MGRSRRSPSPCLTFNAEDARYLVMTRCQRLPCEDESREERRTSKLDEASMHIKVITLILGVQRVSAW